MLITWGLSAKGTSGSVSAQAQSGNKQVFGSHGPGGTPSSGLHVLDSAEQHNPRSTTTTKNRAILKKELMEIYVIIIDHQQTFVIHQLVFHKHLITTKIYEIQVRI